MKRYLIFTKKELIEQLKNYKLVVLGSVLLIFAMLSPVTAKMMPDIFSNMELGIEFVIPEPTYIDAYAQFFKNMNQMVVFLVIFLFSGNIAQEMNRGTAVLMFAKGLSKPAFVFSKFTAELLIWTIGYWAAVGVFWAYTQFLFTDQTPANFFLAMFSLWLLITFLIALINLASVVTNQSYMTMILTGGVMLIFYIAGSFPNLSEYLPVTLGSINLDLIAGSRPASDVLLPAVVSVGLSVASLLTAALLFQQKQL